MPARKKKNFLDDLSNSGRPFDYMVKAGQPAPPKDHEIKTVTGEKESCPNIWFVTTSPTTSTRPL